MTAREKDLIIRSGHNIDPVAIEEVANAHPPSLSVPRSACRTATPGNCRCFCRSLARPQHRYRRAGGLHRRAHLRAPQDRVTCSFWTRSPSLASGTYSADIAGNGAEPQVAHGSRCTGRRSRCWTSLAVSAGGRPSKLRAIHPAEQAEQRARLADALARLPVAVQWTVTDRWPLRRSLPALCHASGWGAKA